MYDYIVYIKYTNIDVSLYLVDLAISIFTPALAPIPAPIPK